MISPETIERIRSETDIVELIGGYLPLKKVGRNFRGVCPFHPDRSPSFYVSLERQTYHCFGCGAGGNAVGFVMEREKLAFPEAVRFLGRRLGIEVSTEQAGPHQALYDACEQAARFYEAQLRRSDTALGYLVRRDIPPEVVKRYRLGYAPPGNRLRGEVKRRGWDLGSFRRAGLVADRGAGPVDYFTNRLVCPIFTPGGKVIGFGGRVLDEREPKYLNSPETEVYHKGDGLYGLFQAKPHLRESPALLVEGNFDLLALVGRGFPNTVAPLGTALTPGQALLIRRYTGSVIVCFDGDEAGRRAARRAIEPLLRAGLDPRVARLPAGSDPDDHVRRYGHESFGRLVAEAVDFVDLLTGGSLPESVAEQRQVLGELVALLKVIADPATRELYANRVAAAFRVDKRVLVRDSPSPSPPKRKAVRPEFEEMIASAVVQDSELAEIAAELNLPTMLADTGIRAIVEQALAWRKEPNYGPALLLDHFEDEEARRRIAGWALRDDGGHSAEQFRERIRHRMNARLPLQEGMMERVEQLAEELDRLEGSKGTTGEANAEQSDEED